MNLFHRLLKIKFLDYFFIQIKIKLIINLIIFYFINLILFKQNFFQLKIF